MGVPEETGVASAVLVTWMDGHCTTRAIGPAELSVRTVEGSLVADSEAVSLQARRPSEPVEAPTCTTRLWPASSEMGWPARVRVWEPAAPPTVNAAALAPPLMAQVTGVAVPPGRASVRLTPVAAPAPWLETVTV